MTHMMNPAAVLPSLADRVADDDSQVRAAAAGNPALPRTTMLEVARYGDRGICVALAGNPQVTPGALRALSDHGSSRVREATVRSPRLDLVLVRLMWTDPDPEVRASARTAASRRGAARAAI